MQELPLLLTRGKCTFMNAKKRMVETEQGVETATNCLCEAFRTKPVFLEDPHCTSDSAVRCAMPASVKSSIIMSSLQSILLRYKLWS
jgi:hypothetical protein